MSDFYKIRFEQVYNEQKGNRMKKAAKKGKLEKKKQNKIRWGTIIPLIGGSAIGCEQATGTLPDFHLSYSPFTNNEKHLRRY